MESVWEQRRWSIAERVTDRILGITHRWNNSESARAGSVLGSLQIQIATNTKHKVVYEIANDAGSAGAKKIVINLTTVECEPYSVLRI